MSTGAICATARPAVHIEDRGLQLGDSVYEVCRIANGRLVDEEEHLDRLERSLREIEMAMPMSSAALRHVMGEIVRRNAVREGMLYMQVTRGALRRDHRDPIRRSEADSDRDRRVPSIKRRSQSAARKALRSSRRPDERWARCDIKTTQLLPNLLAKTAAQTGRGLRGLAGRLLKDL